MNSIKIIIELKDPSYKFWDFPKLENFLKYGKYFYLKSSKKYFLKILENFYFKLWDDGIFY